MAVIKFLLVCLIFNSSFIYCNDKLIAKDIKFEGLHQIDLETALLKTTIHPGDIITDKKLRETIRSLFSTNNFEDVAILNENNVLIIRVKERPIISKVVFLGNKTIKRDLLKEILKTHGIILGNMLDRAEVFNLKRILKDFFYSIGKYDASVEILLTNLPNNRVSVQITFSEGKIAKIRQINILGNHLFSFKELISNFELRDHHAWWDIFHNRSYKEEQFVKDLNNLRSFYIDRGYINFNIDLINFNLTPDKRDLYLTLNIKEGEQYTLDSISLKGKMNSYLPQIKKMIEKIKLHKIYDNSEILKVEDDIKELLDNYGYFDLDVSNKFEINNINKTIKVCININIGKRFYVRHILFVGNKVTKDSVLRREMRQSEGSLISNHLINQGQDRLNRLGYFESVSTQIQRVSDSSDQIDVIYKVKEKNAGRISFGFGLGTKSNFNFQFIIKQENWLGTGNSFEFNGTKNNYQTYFMMSVINPYIGVNNLNLNNKIFYNKFKSNNSDLSHYNLMRYGFNTSVGFSVSENQTLNTGIDFIHEDLSNVKPQIAVLRYLKSNNIHMKQTKNQDLNGKIQFGTSDYFATLDWNYNNVNQGYFPTMGSNINLSNKITLPYSDNKYYETMLDIKHYLPLSKNSDLVLIERASIYFAGKLKKKEIPFYKNFLAGGSDTIRGFHSNSIGPKSIYYDCASSDKTYDSCKLKTSTDTIGGNILAVVSAELVVPTPFLEENYKNLIRTSFFVDLGNVWDSSWKNTKNSISEKIKDYDDNNKVRISGGISFQWLSPLGPVVFSYAYPLRKCKNDKLEQFQFNIGKTW